MTKVLIIGGNDSISGIVLSELKSKYGNDVVIYSPEEAQSIGLTMDDFANIPNYKITPTVISDIGIIKSGKEKRRERRKNERKNRQP